MNTLFQNRTLLFIVLLFVCLFSNCQKKEFLPEPEGKEIPLIDLPKLNQILAKEASLFYQAWEKAEMQNLMSTVYPQTQFTYLIPSNAAMEKAGFDEKKIKEFKKEDLQKIIKFHILNSPFSSDLLANANMDIIAKSLLIASKIYYAPSRNKIEYFQYKHYLNFIKGNLFINGKQIPLIKEISTQQGNTLIIDQFLKINDNQMLQVLKDNKQFSLYLKALELSLPLYQNAIDKNFWSFSINIPMHYILDYYYYFPNTLYETSNKKRILINFTLFAPTNEAFNNIGINNETDLLALLNRGPKINYGSRKQYTPIDSLLILHTAQFVSSSSEFVPGDDPNDYDKYRVSLVLDNDQREMVFFTTAFDEIYFPKFLTNTRVASNGKPEPFYYNHKFKLENGQIKVSHDDSKVIDATIVEGNLNSIQGPVHAVNKIFVPKGFTMWHLKK